MYKPDYETLELLFRKILRGYNCGYAMPDGDVGVELSRFLVTPESDDDARIGFWTQEETVHAVELVQQLLATEPRFRDPRKTSGVNPYAVEYDEWVQSELRSIASLNDLGYEHMNVVSVIS
jgi:hypothetical protein